MANSKELVRLDGIVQVHIADFHKFNDRSLLYQWFIFAEGVKIPAAAGPIGNSEPLSKVKGLRASNDNDGKGYTAQQGATEAARRYLTACHAAFPPAKKAPASRSSA